MPTQNLILVARLQQAETITPIAKAAGDPINPAAGVTPTRPAIMPEQAPMRDHFLSRRTGETIRIGDEGTDWKETDSP